jgi:prepilin-type processing-associated H-X9-DG protein
MKTRCARQETDAFTLIEVFIVMFVIAVLALALTPRIRSPYRVPRAATCTDNLKRLDLAYKVWAGDHNDKFPAQISVADGGAMELVGGPDAWKVFLVISNALDSPQILICPADTRQFARNLGSSFSRTNISYFINPNATDSDPQMLFFGDDNFEIAGAPVKPGLLELSSNIPIAWSASRHKFSGNIALADGSVQGVSTTGLTNALYQTGIVTNRLIIP